MYNSFANTCGLISLPSYFRENSSELVNHSLKSDHLKGGILDTDLGGILDTDLGFTICSIFTPLLHKSELAFHLFLRQ